MKLSILYFLALAFLSCHSGNKATNNYKPHFRVSPFTSLFIERLKQENPAQPSATFISDFALLSIKGQYYVSGMATVNRDFDEKKLERLHARVNTKAGNICTVQIPLINFNKFLQLNGFDYFELSSRVSIKKQ